VETLGSHPCCDGYNQLPIAHGRSKRLADTANNLRLDRKDHDIGRTCDCAVIITQGAEPQVSQRVEGRIAGICGAD
jgi:hypothetical protein